MLAVLSLWRVAGGEQSSTAECLGFTKEILSAIGDGST